MGDIGRMAKIERVDDRPPTDAELHRLAVDVDAAIERAQLLGNEREDMLRLMKRLIVFEKQRRGLRGVALGREDRRDQERRTTIFDEPPSSWKPPAW